MTTERLDNFTDAAFAFAISLLVIGGAGAPANFEALQAALGDVPAYAFGFAVIAMFWSGHVRWRALRGEGEVYTCRFACDLPARMRTRPPDALILTPVDEAGTDVAPMVRALRRDYPAMPMAVLAPLTPQATGHVVELARAGIDEVILRGHDDVR